jgi:hypothetical protein
VGVRRSLAAALALVLLVVVGIGAALALGEDEREAPPSAQPRSQSPSPGAPTPAADDSPAAEPTDPAPDVVMVRRASGVPPAWARRAADVPGVDSVVVVRRGQAALRVTESSSGRVVSRARAGFAVPIDTLVASPRAYADTLSGADRAALASLRGREAVLSESAAAVRGVGRGGLLVFAGGSRVRVGAVVSDSALGGAEMLVSSSSGSLVSTRAAHLLVVASEDGAEAQLSREFRGDRVRVVSRGGPASTGRGGIARPLELKQRFGEVAVALPFGADYVRLDPAWVRKNIAARPVPILGTVTCNRAIIKPLRAALGELQRRKLAKLVDTGDYAGCYAPRRIPNSGSLSLHALGLAVDLNASVNGQYEKSTQDPRLVRIMEKHGFTWGGRWPTAPDPMHFEWHGE